VTLAAHVAAMAPGTSIGAASPVGPEGQDLPDTMRSKAESIMVTQIRNLAARRGEQAQDWAEDAVLRAVSASPEEALSHNVVDLIAASLEDLLSQLHGRPLTVGDRAVVLDTYGAEVRDVEMSALESFFGALASPNVAYILMTLGMMGLVYEFASPGFGFGGVVGSICLLLGVYSLGMLPANYAGVALLLLAFALFFADAKLGTGGLIALGGVVSMVVGGMILFDAPELSVSPAILWPTALACGAFFAFAASRVLAINRKRATTGREGLVGATGSARGTLAPDGIVLVWGETWRATAEGGDVAAGQAVEVVAVEGLRLRVRAAPERNEVNA